MIDWVFYIYVGIGVVSLVLMMLMFILGGLDFDFDFGGGSPDVDVDVGLDVGVDAGMGPLSLPMILAFLALLGGIGSILTYMEFHVVATPFIAGIASLALSAVIFLVMNYLLKVIQADSTVKFRDLVGKKGSVSVPMKPGQEGQIVLFTEQRGRTLVPAIAERPIPMNTSVIITSVQGDTVVVMTLSEWRKKSKDNRQKRRTKER